MANNKDFVLANPIELGGPMSGSAGTVTSSTEGEYLIANAFYQNKKFPLQPDITLCVDVEFSSDGTKMYVLSSAPNDELLQYNLSTAWDITTAVYSSSDDLSVSSENTSPIGMFFKPDGLSVYIARLSTATVFQYDLTTAWDLSTASYASKSYNPTEVSTELRDVLFNSTGTKMYALSSTNDAVYQYSLSTAWDLGSTITYDTKTLDVSSFDTTPQSMLFNDDGTKFYLNGQQNDNLRQFSLSTAYDISTATDDGITLDFSSEDTSSFGARFSASGDKVYMVGYVSSNVYQYQVATAIKTLDLSTGTVFDLDPELPSTVKLSNPPESGTVASANLILTGAGDTIAPDIESLSSSVSSFLLTSQSSNPIALAMKPDGTRMWVQLTGNNDTYQYDLGTAYDVSTAVYNGVTLAPATTMRGMDWSPDGTLFVYCSGADLYWYNAVTPFDLTGITPDSADGSKGISATSAGRGFQFAKDGYRAYTFSQNTNSSGFIQWNLTTAYDLSTATEQSIVYITHSTAYDDYGSLAISQDGTMMFVMGSNATNSAMYPYVLDEPFEVSSRRLVDSLAVILSGEGGYGHGIKFGNNDKILYTVDMSTDKVHQFNCVTENVHAITYDSSIKFEGGNAPTRTFGEKDLMTFTTDDGGTTYNGFRAASNLS